MALSKFESAFAAARKSGKSTFDFNGKKYTTELAKPKPKPKAMSTADKASMATKMLGNAPEGTSQYAKQKLRDLARGLQKQADNESRMKAYGSRSAGESKRVPMTRVSNVEVAGPVAAKGMKCGGKVTKKR